MRSCETEVLIEALEPVLGDRLQRSSELCRLARAVGLWLVAQADRAENAGAGDDGASVVRTDEPVGPSVVVPGSAIQGPRVVAPAPKHDVPLRLGGADVSVQVHGCDEEIERVHAQAEVAGSVAGPGASGSQKDSSIDIGLIAERCALKAEGCRGFVRRRAAAPGSFEYEERVGAVGELINRARELRDCLLWMFFEGHEYPDDEMMERIARWYAAQGAAAALLVLIDGSSSERRSDIEQVFQLFAHANAGLRVALESTWLTRPDIDQEEGHLWLGWETKVRGVYVPRYMRLSDIPDPDTLEDLESSLASLRGEIEERLRQEKEIREALKRMRYHAELLSDGRSLDEGHDWDKIESSLAFLEGFGVLADDARVLTAIEELAEVEIQPEVLGGRSGVALGALRAMVQQAEDAEERGASRERAWSDRVREVRGWLAGCRIVVVGGEERPRAVDRFVEAFGLAGVDWVALTEHGSSDGLRAPIEREGTALVLILIKLTGHKHAEEARRFAKASGRPFVILKAGYNPERVALAVCNQASEQLAQRV